MVGIPTIADYRRRRNNRGRRGYASLRNIYFGIFYEFIRSSRIVNIRLDTVALNTDSYSERSRNWPFLAETAQICARMSEQRRRINSLQNEGLAFGAGIAV